MYIWCNILLITTENFNSAIGLIVLHLYQGGHQFLFQLVTLGLHGHPFQRSTMSQKCGQIKLLSILKLLVLVEKVMFY